LSWAEIRAEIWAEPAKAGAARRIPITELRFIVSFIELVLTPGLNIHLANSDAAEFLFLRCARSGAIRPRSPYVPKPRRDLVASWEVETIVDIHVCAVRSHFTY
jgi:hypothetical protein